MTQEGMTYEIDEARELAIVTGSGIVTMPEMIHTSDTLADDPRFRTEFRAIFDLRTVSYTAELSDGEDFVAALNRRMADFQGGISLVVPEILHGLVRLYAVLAKVSGYDGISCFIHMEKALEQVDIEPL
jgi:hypothetical protein